MGCDTRGLLKGNPTVEDVIAVLNKKKEYKVVDSEVSYDNIFKTDSGYLYLKNKRSLLYSSKVLDPHETTKGENIQIDNYSWVSLGHDKEAIEIITYLCKEFGGFIDKNDCDDVEFEIVKGKNSKSVTEQLHKQRIAENLERLINLTKVEKDTEYKVNYVESKDTSKVEIIRITNGKKEKIAEQSTNLDSPQGMFRDTMKAMLGTEEW